MGRGAESDMTERLHFHFSLSCLEKEMATHSSVLAWRIPGIGEPGGLPSMGSQRVGQDWSDSSSSSSIQSKQSNKFILLWFIPEYQILCSIWFEFYYLLSQALIHFSGKKINASRCRKCVHICLLHQISTVSFAFNCQNWNSIENILSKLVYQLSNAKYMLLQNTCPSVGRYLETRHNYWFPT